MAAYSITGAVTVGVVVATSMIYNPTGSAYDTSLTGYAIYDGLTIPPDSLLMYENGQDDTSAAAAFLTDSTASFGTDTYNTGFIVRNTSKATSGVIETATITDTTNTTIVGTLSNSATWDSGNYYEVVIAGLAAGDRIYHDPLAVASVFSWQLYDKSTNDFSAVYTATLTPAVNGAVSVTAKGVPSILVDIRSITGNITVTIAPAATMLYTDISAAAVATKGGYVPPTYKKGELRKKDESILAKVNELVEKLEASPIAPLSKVDKKVVEIQQKATIIATTQGKEHARGMLNLSRQVKTLEKMVDRHIQMAQEDEDDAINAIISIL